MADSTPQKAVLYSYDPILPVDLDGILRSALEMNPPLEVVLRFIGSQGDRPKFTEALVVAKEVGATTLLLPQAASLGPISSTMFRKKYLPILDRDGIRVRAIADPHLDTANESFIYGFLWASTSRARLISARQIEWHTDKREAGERTGRFAICRCNHPVTRIGGVGHNRVEGEIGSCRAPGCGCSVYRPRNEILMGVVRPVAVAVTQSPRPDGSQSE